MFTWLNKMTRKTAAPVATGQCLRTPAERLAHFGVDIISASRANSIATTIVDLTSLGFAALKPNFWAKQVSSDIVQLLSLHGTKGAGYAFTWGLSLAFIPHAWDSELKYHRTMKSSRFDLFEDALEFLVREATQEKAHLYCIDGLYGSECFESDLRSAWSELKPYAVEWFTKTQSLEAVVEQARSQAAHHWIGPLHRPDPRMVAAFALARLGRRGDARAELATLARSDSQTYGTPRLQEALESVESLRPL